MKNAETFQDQFSRRRNLIVESVAGYAAMAAVTDSNAGRNTVEAECKVSYCTRDNHISSNRFKIRLERNIGAKKG